MPCPDLEGESTETEPVCPPPSHPPARWFQGQHHWLTAIHRQSAHLPAPPEMDVLGPGDSQSSIHEPYSPRLCSQLPGEPQQATLNKDHHRAHRLPLGL